ncbi:MAG TPA: hypothetical protein VNR67_02465, partial [Solirubrobacterales bacterium]|nr:hypothetical protein [Solirubrobacterales bacterium]
MIEGVDIWQSEFAGGDSWPILRRVLGHYLDRAPEASELERGEHGKPRLREPRGIEFSLSHSRGLAVVAVAARAVGVDVEAIVPRRGRPAEFYEEWVRREATVKCLGVGLLSDLPDRPVAVEGFDAGPGYAAAVALAGHAVGPVRARTLSARSGRCGGRGDGGRSLPPDHRARGG